MSKEIATLENDMLELKDLLNQWKDLPQLMGMEDTLAPTLDKYGNCESRLVHYPFRAHSSGETKDTAKFCSGSGANVQGSTLQSVVDRRGITKIHPSSPRTSPRF